MWSRLKIMKFSASNDSKTRETARGQLKETAAYYYFSTGKLIGS